MAQNKRHTAVREIGARLASGARDAGLGAWRAGRVAGTDHTMTFRITRSDRAKADVLYTETARWLRSQRDVRSLVVGTVTRTGRGWRIEIECELHPKSVDAHADDRTTAEDLDTGDVLADGRTVAWTMRLEGGDVSVGFVGQGSDRHDPRDLFDVVTRGADNPERNW